jgi:repressor LexA
MAKLTRKQTEILEFLRERDHVGGSAPTYREIGKHFGFKSPKAATDHVSALEKKGYLRRHGRRSRGIELIRSERAEDRATINVPILGQIQAGNPNEEIEGNQGSLAIDKSILGLSAGNRLFLLEVHGRSMTGCGVFEGDWVVADADCPPHEGNMVVALIDGQSTLKTLAMEKGAFFLKPENPDFVDLIPVTEMSIQGVVKLILRRVN